MNLSKLIPTRKRSVENRKMKAKKNFGDPQFILKQLSNFLNEGDFSSSTDLISAYISNSSKLDRFGRD